MSKMINTPAGPFFIDDDATPEAIARAKTDFMARNKAKPAAAPRKLTADEQEVQRRANIQRKQESGAVLGRTGANMARKVFQGFSFNGLDELNGALSAGTSGVVKAFKKGDIGEIGHEYRLARDTERALNHDADGRAGTIAEIAGALLNPIGTGAKGLQWLGKAGKYAAPLARAGTKLEKAPAVVQGIAAGASQGAANAVGADESAKNVGDLLNRAGQGFLAGGFGGGVLGAATTGLRRGVQILRDRAPEAADRIAHTKIGNMIDNAGKTPEQIERELMVTNARDGDGMLMDMSPGLRAQAGAMSRRPEVPSSNAMIERGEQRLLDRPAKYEQKIREHATPSTGVDAAAHTASTEGARKAYGQHDYEQALDGKFHWSRDMQQFVDKADPEIHNAFREGARLASLHDQDIGQLGMKINPTTGLPEFHTTPSMRVFDYTKRALDQKIGAAYKAGNDAYAKGLSNQLGKFKQMIMDANPEYAGVLAKQRDFYQKAQATELGTTVVSRLKTEPKKVLAELRALDPTKHDDARTGIVDALIGLRAQKQDPVAWFKGMARTPEQRKILEFAFNGKGNLNRFERWMDRELRAKKADVLTAPGRQSETARFQSADDSLNEGVGGIAEHGLRGFAFGGTAGASAAVFRKFNDLRTGMSPHALDAMAKALMGDGSGVAGKVSAARKFTAARKIKNARAAIRAAKAGQQSITDYAGE